MFHPTRALVISYTFLIAVTEPWCLKQLTVLGTNVVDVVVKRWSHPTVNLIRRCHSLKRMFLLPAANNWKHYYRDTHHMHVTEAALD